MFRKLIASLKRFIVSPTVRTEPTLTSVWVGPMPIRKEPILTPTQVASPKPASKRLYLDDPNDLTIVQRARRLYDDESFDALRGFKRAKRKSWKVLGFNIYEMEKIESAPTYV